MEKGNNQFLENLQYYNDYSFQLYFLYLSINWLQSKNRQV